MYEAFALVRVSSSPVPSVAWHIFSRLHIKQSFHSGQRHITLHIHRKNHGDILPPNREPAFRFDNDNTVFCADCSRGLTSDKCCIFNFAMKQFSQQVPARFTTENIPPVVNAGRGDIIDSSHFLDGQPTFACGQKRFAHISLVSSCFLSQYSRRVWALRIEGLIVSLFVLAIFDSSIDRM